MADQSTNTAMTTVMIILLLVLAFGGGYYYYQHKDKDTTIELNVGDDSSSMELDTGN